MTLPRLSRLALLTTEAEVAALQRSASACTTHDSTAGCQTIGCDELGICYRAECREAATIVSAIRALTGGKTR